ncbi:MAG TPA: type II secretion system protein M [Steroidobacteraceae bacterium]|jgi:general secretion pathway protein M|nr:type II secretion system protein M [Steroidobacteraceae bacterium]
MKTDLSSLSFEGFSALPLRQQRLVLGGAALIVVLLIVAVLIPLDHSVTSAQLRVAKKRADLTWMQGVAPELATAPAPPSDSGESLLVIVDRSARESGLAGSLTGSEPGTGGSLSVRLQKAPFDMLVAWLARLAQQNGVVVDSATIDGAGAPGLVNAAVVLRSG